MSIEKENMKIFIEINTRFEGIHRWDNAPEAVFFLRNAHRHEFHVQARIQAYHDDRELEFILVKKQIEMWVRALSFDLGQKSCEMLAKELAAFLLEKYGNDKQRHVEVRISEDGENGALVLYDA
ncbi:MAG: hypothetical protein C3F06_10305 [Candidatus Methanoperedenaceae archaeon]|nr:MAG: hypothetical protein C3F06_10305 [Candidatus Methanoperedenaceae archaeon]